MGTVLSSLSKPFSASNQHEKFRLLLVGETGSGKTSLLNLIANLGSLMELGNSFDKAKAIERCRDYHDIKFERNVSSMQSKTDAANCYNIRLKNVEIEIIDTPGFGDTRGIETDQQHVKKIIAELEHRKYIHGICLVANGTQAKMSTTLRYVLTQITSIMPQEVVNNLFVVFTNCQSILDVNYDVDELKSFFFGKDSSREIQAWTINNPYCRLQKLKESNRSFPLDKIALSLQSNFEETASQIADMFQAISTKNVVYTKSFVELHNVKEKIETEIMKTLNEMDDCASLAKEIARQQDIFAAARDKKLLHATYKTTRQQRVQKAEATPHHNTLCSYSGCKSNCHEHCQLPFGLQEPSKCHAMNGTNVCQYCKHPANVHYHIRSKWIEVVETQELIDPKMKKVFEEAKSEEERQLVYIEGLEMKKAELEMKIAQASQKLIGLVEEFEKKAVVKSFLKFLRAQIDCVEERIQSFDDDKQFLTCPVCYQSYSNTREPKVLAKCGHTCCSECVNRIRECAMCRKPFSNADIVSNYAVKSEISPAHLTLKKTRDELMKKLELLQDQVLNKVSNMDVV